jgi:Fic family protein
VPPVCSRVEELLKDLITFSKREDVDAISKAAIIHAQFETIHPFLDGNGRVGRTILHTILKHEGALTNSAIPISAGLLNNLDKYFKSLNDYRSGNYSSIINDFCIAIQNGILIADIMVKKIEETLMN